MHDIFLSYRRKDTGPYTAWLYSHLNRRFCGRVFFDLKRIDAGAKFSDEIRQEVSHCKVLLAMIGPDWVTVRSESGRRRIDNRSDLVRQEIAMALERADAIVIPVLAGEDAKMPDADKDELPEPLAAISKRNGFKITYENFEDGAGRLIAQLEKVLGEPPQAAQAAPAQETAEAQLLIQAETAVRLGDWPAAARALQAAAFLPKASPDVLLRLRWVQWRYRLSQISATQPNSGAEPEEWSGASDICTRVIDAVGAFDRDLDRAPAERVCAEFIEALHERDVPFPETPATRILIELCYSGLFDLAENVAGALIETDQDSHAVRRFQGTAMVEQDKISAAVQLLEKLEMESRFDPFENNEVCGQLGKAYQRLYARIGPSGSAERRRTNLDRAIRYFYDVFAQEANPALWHGISAAALLFRAKQDGFTLPDYPDPEALARMIIGTVERRDIERQADMWCFAAAAEACASLGRRDDAMRWTARYVRSDYADRLELKRMQRRLQEIWQPAASPAIFSEMITLINARLLESRHGQVTIDPSAVQAAAEKPARLERIFDVESSRSVDWYREGLARCRSIGRLERPNGLPLGTGFLAGGADLHPSLSDRMVLLTCAYMVDPRGALRPEDLTVRFMGETGAPAYRIGRMLWVSPIEDLDTMILELDPPAAGFPAFKIAAAPPSSGGGSEVYIFGHAGGRELSLSSGALIDVDDTRLRYRVPTEGGSGGSPVLNERWELLGMHHLGGPEANEGVRIPAIIRALAEDLS